MERMGGRVVVVTGAASGIGEASARLFIEEGARVVIADIQEELGREVAKEFGDSARFVQCDVTDESSVEAAVHIAMKEWGQLDCMFNNAGSVGSATGTIAEIDAAAWDRTVAILIRSVFLGTKHAARVMIPRRSGVILNTSSTAGVLGGIGPHAYSTSKHAVIGVTKSAASELSAFGIRVNSIAPGAVLTPLAAGVRAAEASDRKAALELAAERLRATSPLGFTPLASDVAHAALYLASEEARFVSGHTVVVDGGQTINGNVWKFPMGTSGGSA